MNTMDVANTIVEQLGGRKFIAMTGAHTFLGDADSVSFALSGGGGFCKSGINRVHIKLEPSDTYTMTFYRLTRGTKLATVATHADVYFDSLQELFARETGLAVSL